MPLVVLTRLTGQDHQLVGTNYWIADKSGRTLGITFPVLLNTKLLRKDWRIEMEREFVQLDMVKKEPPAWVWPQRIRLGAVTVLLGDPGTNKSTLTTEIAARVTTGRPMFNCTGSPRPGAALMISAEDDLASTVLPRLEAAGAKMNLVSAPAQSPENGLLRLPADLAELERHAMDRRATLIIIDPLMALDVSDRNTSSR